MKKPAISVLFLLFFLIDGCATWQAEMKENNQNLLKLDMGMSKDEVLGIMGQPTFNEAYESLNGSPIVIFFYYTQRKWADGSYTKDETTPIVFENGRLIGWGAEFYKKKMEIDVNIKSE